MGWAELAVTAAAAVAVVGWWGVVRWTRRAGLVRLAVVAWGAEVVRLAAELAVVATLLLEDATGVVVLRLFLLH